MCSSLMPELPMPKGHAPGPLEQAHELARPRYRIPLAHDMPGVANERVIVAAEGVIAHIGATICDDLRPHSWALLQVRQHAHMLLACVCACMRA